MFNSLHKVTPLFGALLTVCCLAMPVGLAQAEGVSVGKASVLRNLVPAQQLEQQAAVQYAEVLQKAAADHTLGADNDSQVRRLRAIATRIIPFSNKFNGNASQWKWEVNLIHDAQLNAFCMPGGKIAVYSGLVETLKLSDDEIAIVMAHEIAHALREHARARMAKSELTQFGISILSQKIGGGQYGSLFQAGGSLLTLKFSRGDETDADIVGLELAARAGYDPRAGVSLWQKMTANNKGAPPQWLSTHPSGQNRVQEIQRHLPEVMPLYEKARK
ncbi:MAG: M48 family metallopeptidase [Gallionella sp.]|nr:M48 family metallopeptidase [Gallionella sp.]